MQIVVDVCFSKGGGVELGAVDVDSNRLFWGSFRRHGKLIGAGKKLRLNDPLHCEDPPTFDAGFISHHELMPALEAIIEGATVLYAFGEAECEFLSDLTGRTFISLEKELNCPAPDKCSFPSFSCLNPCHKLRSSVCALRNAHALAQWFQYYRLKSEVDPCTSHECTPPSPLPPPPSSS